MPVAHTGVYYVDFLGALNRHVAPRSYFEIGTHRGESLLAFTCDALSVDPGYQIAHDVIRKRKRSFFFQMTSDEFFSDHRIKHFIPRGPDICFLDGMHRFEYLLRDFYRTEQSCHRRSVILIHDCFPTNVRMAERTHRIEETEDPASRQSWTGDVWRILPALKKYRPDLRLLCLDCPPTGLLACTNLNPSSDILEISYQAIVDEFLHMELPDYGLERLWTDFTLLDSHSLVARPWDLSGLFPVF